MADPYPQRIAESFYKPVESEPEKVSEAKSTISEELSVIEEAKLKGMGFPDLASALKNLDKMLAKANSSSSSNVYAKEEATKALSKAKEWAERAMYYLKDFVELEKLKGDNEQYGLPYSK